MHRALWLWACIAFTCTGLPGSLALIVMRSLWTSRHQTAVGCLGQPPGLTVWQRVTGVQNACHSSTGVVQEGLDVSYPGLKTHPHHERLEALRNPGYGHGGM